MIDDGGNTKKRTPTRLDGQIFVKVRSSTLPHELWCHRKNKQKSKVTSNIGAISSYYTIYLYKLFVYPFFYCARTRVCNYCCYMIVCTCRKKLVRRPEYYVPQNGCFTFDWLKIRTNQKKMIKDSNNKTLVFDLNFNKLVSIFYYLTSNAVCLEINNVQIPCRYADIMNYTYLHIFRK